VRGIADVEYRFECTCVALADEVLFSGDTGSRLVIVLAQRSRGVESGYREIARMRQMIDVSIPRRAYCIGDGIACRQCGFYTLRELCYILDRSLILISLLYCIRH
jgi:hypothetical protein